jgi:hypothetical protein
MKYFVLFYDVVDDFVSRRATHREEHLRLAQEALHRGELLLAGAFTEPADRTLQVWPRRRGEAESDRRGHARRGWACSCFTRPEGSRK